MGQTLTKKLDFEGLSRIEEETSPYPPYEKYNTFIILGVEDFISNLLKAGYKPNQTIKYTITIEPAD